MKEVNVKLAQNLYLYNSKNLISLPMKVLLEIKYDKATFILELLYSLKYVKTTPLSPDAAEVLEEIKKGVEEVNQIKAGKKKAKS